MATLQTLLLAFFLAGATALTEFECAGPYPSGYGSRDGINGSSLYHLQVIKHSSEYYIVNLIAVAKIAPDIWDFTIQARPLSGEYETFGTFEPFEDTDYEQATTCLRANDTAVSAKVDGYLKASIKWIPPKTGKNSVRFEASVVYYIYWYYGVYSGVITYGE